MFHSTGCTQIQVGVGVVEDTAAAQDEEIERGYDLLSLASRDAAQLHSPIDVMAACLSMASARSITQLAGRVLSGEFDPEPLQQAA